MLQMMRWTLTMCGNAPMKGSIDADRQGPGGPVIAVADFTDMYVDADAWLTTCGPVEGVSLQYGLRAKPTGLRRHV